MRDLTLYQYCQKIVVFRNDDTELLLAKRKGEADYDQTYAFIGGKMEITDPDIIDGLRREKTEEIGSDAKLKIWPKFSYNVHYVKKDGNHMILPHYYAQYVSGEISLNNEYHDYKWVKTKDLSAFEPKIDNMVGALHAVLKLKTILDSKDFTEI